MEWRNGRTVTAGLAIAVVAAAVIGGIALLDSPQQERALRLDATRLTDLRRLAEGVDLFWTRHERLPGSAVELSGEPGVSVGLADPETGEPYEYRAVGDSAYQLCAGFARAAASGETEPGFWSHGVGRQCFERTAVKLEGRWPHP